MQISLIIMAISGQDLKYKSVTREKIIKGLRDPNPQQIRMPLCVGLNQLNIITNDKPMPPRKVSSFLGTEALLLASSYDNPSGISPKSSGAMQSQ